MNKITKFELTSFHLRLIAMISMLLDHAVKSVNFNFNYDFMYFLGRLAFPIFAFQLVEGYMHTKNFNRYCIKMFIFALIAEIPFNLMIGYSPIYPFGQNVLFTMLIGLLMMKLTDIVIDYTKDTNKFILVLSVMIVVVLGYIIGKYCFVDYGGEGILMILMFYLSKKSKYAPIIQLIGLIIINSFMIMGQTIVLSFGASLVSFHLQSFATLAIIPIWMYKGKQGYHSKWWSDFCYMYYPIHIIIVLLIGTYVM